ncbi:hypothetical protein AAMO2058_001654700 [Amorphochlora amoebiformis]
MEPIQPSANPLQELQERLEKLGIDGKSAGAVDKKDFIKFMDDNKIRKPELVVRFGQQLLKNHSSFLGEDEWDMREKVLIAALDSGEYKVAMEMYGSLEAKFSKPKGEPPSRRLKKLEAMIKEHNGAYDSATKVYTDEILQHDKVNPSGFRRLYCIAKAQGNYSDAAKRLNYYLKLFPGDIEGWIELAELYVSVDRLDFSKFCYEEAMMLAPQDYHLSVVSLSLSQKGRKGSVKNPMELARMYYIQSLELAPGNTRALLGLAMCLRALKVTPQTQNLFEWTEAEIARAYSKAGPTGRKLLGTVRAALKQ